MMQQYPAYKDSSLNWLSKIPVHWDELPNIAIFQERIERGFEANELLSVTMAEGIIRQNELETKKDISNENKSNYKRVRTGDIAYNKMRMWQGAVGYSRYEGIVSPAYVVLRPKCNINPKYFHYLFRIPWYTNESYRNSYGIHDDQLSLRYVDFKRMYSPFPPIEEQEAIVAFLEEQTAVINQFLANKRQLIALLEEQKQVVINTAVTQGLDPNTPRKPSGIDWLSDIPAHWEIKKIGYISEVGNGSTPSRSNMRYWQDGTYPWLNSSSVNQGVIVEADQFVTPTALKECHLPIVKPNSILIAITGQGKTRGTAALLTFEATINQHMAYITPLPKVITSDYLVTFLQGNYNYLRYISDGQGGTKGALTCGDIKQLKIPVPPPAEQEIIVERVKQTLSEINTAIERIQREIELIEEYRTTLIAHAVTGKIDVRPQPEMA